MTNKQVEQYQQKLTELVAEAAKEARDSALLFIVNNDQVAHRNAITSHAAELTFEAALAEFNNIIKGNEE